MRHLLGFVSLALSFAAFSADIPGGLARISEGLPNNTYEVALSPAYTLNPGGAYLTSELRYQANEDFGAGFGFGAGEVGFNFGANGTWYIAPDIDSQPAFSVLGGVYLNRVVESNYLALRIVPTISKMIPQDWGKVTPYASAQMTPAFQLGDPDNSFSIRTNIGTLFELKAMQGLRLFTELGLAVMNSNSEIIFGISYPFKAL
ncbi:MAG: hypothetical protein FJ116_03135 [Deltaproteobacteria bacterium]|nr:hypothetical protein [Deltaproteobacteria bacterium]MBM4316457.1 hypothetical protein [Deltaproteobacteria bacterium]